MEATQKRGRHAEGRPRKPRRVPQWWFGYLLWEDHQFGPMVAGRRRNVRIAAITLAGLVVALVWALLWMTTTIANVVHSWPHFTGGMG